MLLSVTSLSQQNLLLGYNWLKEHNPEINWQTGEIKILWCSGKCSECWAEAKAESRARQLVTCCIHACTLGPAPTLVEDCEEEVFGPADIGSAHDTLANEDCIFATSLAPLVEDVCISATTSQRLVEAFRKNNQMANSPSGF